MRSHMWIKLAALLMLLAATGATSSNSPARALSVEYNVNEKKYLRGDSSKKSSTERRAKFLEEHMDQLRQLFV
ncbi:hypothetical protein GN244_ATG17141 [Phytophthora infestans]|uniref:Secreted RxLR effector peptide protein n=1 Tax=Phytophthora infestans TaxID=4787 RepID=A0A833SZF7_PHYIN|nr:hypothetical protein GN244_ATG17141 [Phytophthora infestans]KAF4141845.1 hypothetical protein GN958_ATG08950 [Phytophthora infestans]KAF4149169.1 hypothetical protein GN958_ATG01710 [Phytophthora infestans]